jgi:hypothetical protein
MTGMSFCGVLGWRIRSIGDRSISPSLASHLKNCCRPLCLFSAVAADRVSIILAWNDSTCARVTTHGSAAAASASGSGGVLSHVPAELRGGE